MARLCSRHCREVGASALSQITAACSCGYLEENMQVAESPLPHNPGEKQGLDMSHPEPLCNFVSGCESSTPGCERSSPELPTGGKGSRSQPEHPRGSQEGSAGSIRLVEWVLRAPALPRDARIIKQADPLGSSAMSQSWGARHPLQPWEPTMMGAAPWGGLGGSPLESPGLSAVGRADPQVGRALHEQCFTTPAETTAARPGSAATLTWDFPPGQGILPNRPRPHPAQGHSSRH